MVTPTPVLIKVTGERTRLHVETEKIKSAWPEGKYDSLMLFWLRRWVFSLRGGSGLLLFHNFYRELHHYEAVSETVIIILLLFSQHLTKHQTPPHIHGAQNPSKLTVN